MTDHQHTTLLWQRYMDSEEGSAEEFVAVEELRVIAERAEAAEAELAKLRERLEALAERWRNGAEESRSVSNLIGSSSALRVCADELLEAAKGKP